MVVKVILVQVGWSGRSINHRWTPDVPAWNKPPPTVFYVLSWSCEPLYYSKQTWRCIHSVYYLRKYTEDMMNWETKFSCLSLFLLWLFILPFRLLFLLSFFVLPVFLAFYVFYFFYTVEILLCVFSKQSIIKRSQIFCGKNVIKHSATTNNGDRIWFKICVQCIEKIEDPCRLGE